MSRSTSFSAMCALLIVALLVPVASAASISATTNFISALPAPHYEHFNDFSWEQYVVDNGPDGTGPADGLLNVGDVLEGIMDIESIGVQAGTVGVDRLGTGDTGEVEVTAYFRLQVIGTGMNGTDYVTVFGPDPGFEATYGNGAMAAFFEDATNNLDVSTTASGISTATDGIHLMTLGFAGLDGEGWESLTSTDNVITAAQTGPGTSFGSFSANLNQITSPGLANDMADLDISFSKTSFYGNGSPTQFAVNGQLYGAATNTEFPLSNSADTFFQVVPEPSSLVLLTVFGGLFAACGLRRSRRS